jgi:hypothetical protein
MNAQQIEETVRSLKVWDRVRITLTFKDGTELTAVKNCFPPFAYPMPAENGYLYFRALGNHYPIRYHGGRPDEHITAIENLGPGDAEAQAQTQDVMDHFYRRGAHAKGSNISGEK